MKLFKLTMTCYGLVAVQSFTQVYNRVEQIRRSSNLYVDGDQKEGKRDDVISVYLY